MTTNLDIHPTILVSSQQQIPFNKLNFLIRCFNNITVHIIWLDTISANTSNSKPLCFLALGLVTFTMSPTPASMRMAAIVATSWIDWKNLSLYIFWSSLSSEESSNGLYPAYLVERYTCLKGFPEQCHNQWHRNLNHHSSCFRRQSIQYNVASWIS